MKPLAEDFKSGRKATNTSAKPSLLRSVLAELGFLLKVSRPGFWLTSLWFYMLPLGGRHVFHSVEFWLGALYVTFPLGMLIYGWNDAVDFEADRLNPRKDTFLFGARPTASQIAGLPLRIALVQAPFAIIFACLLGWRALAWLGALTLTTAIYNWPRIGFKGRAGFDLLNQLGYLLVFVLSSWLGGAPQAPWFTFVFGALFAMHSHLFGEIMDHALDLQAGRRTTAGVLGIRASKSLMAAFLACESALLFQWTHSPSMALGLAGGAVWFLLDGAFLWRDRAYSAGQMRLFFLGWNTAALVSLPWVWKTAALAKRF
jgi:4-hydroxybenzoate polyprenyltransferase